LALSDLLSPGPFSPFTYVDEKAAASSPDATLAGEIDIVSITPDVASGADMSPFSLDEQATHDPVMVTMGPTKRPDPLQADWQSTRSQLLPGKNAARKAEWIRGWSEAVGAHGEATYCVCSDSALTSSRTWRVRESVRGIVSGSSSAQRSSASLDVDLCHNCGRAALPLVESNSIGGDPKKMDSQRRGRGLSKKMGNLIRRVMPSRSGPIALGYQKHVDEKGKVEMRHQDLTSAEYRQQSPSIPVATFETVQRAQTDSPAAHAPALNRGRAASSDQSLARDALSNSDDVPRGDGGIMASMSRLQRAAALLDRASRRANE